MGALAGFWRGFSGITCSHETGYGPWLKKCFQPFSPHCPFNIHTLNKKGSVTIFTRELIWYMTQSQSGQQGHSHHFQPTLLALTSPLGEENGNSLQYSCLENLMDRGAWQATVHVAARIRRDLATKPPPPPPLHYFSKPCFSWCLSWFSWHLSWSWHLRSVAYPCPLANLLLLLESLSLALSPLDCSFNHFWMSIWSPRIRLKTLMFC